MSDFTGKTVLVTGGAKGVGRVIVRKLAAQGAHVLVNYFHSRDAARQIVDELRAAGARADLVPGSVAKREQVAAMFAQIRSEHGHLDILINNAASGALRPLDQLDDRDWERTFDTNLKGSLWCAQQAVGLMSSRGGGAIVNLSSIGAGLVLDGYTAVGTSKAAVEALTRYLAVEYAPLGIRVNTASCCLIDGAVAGLFPEAGRLREVIEAATPMGRLASEEEFARLVLFLASDDAAWITGQSVLADGGLSLGNAMLAPRRPEPLPAAPKPPAPSTGVVPPEPPAGAGLELDQGMGIAVVGIGIKVPGADDVDGFFDLLRGDRPVFSEPGNRWEIDSFYAPPGDGTPDSTYARTLGFVRDQSGDIPAQDYTTGWLRHCLTQAVQGVARNATDRHLFTVGYTADGSQHLEESTVWESLLARLAPGLDLADPVITEGLAALRRRLPHAGDEAHRSLPYAVGRAAADGILPPDTELVMVDTACSSSLYALSMGMRALRSGSCDVAVCGASFAVGPRNSTLFASLHGLSASGDVRSFDRDADGVLFSDGAAVVVLKTVERARADGDNILGVLAGVGTSSDGRGRAIYAPNATGQQLAVERALSAAHLHPVDIDWVVAHATGTRAGDQVEIQTLKSTFAASSGCHVTSNKSILGHTGWVAGIVSLIHVLMAMRNEVIPAQRRFIAPPADWHLDESPLTIPTTDVGWPRTADVVRTAAISGFGFGGTNANVVVREYIDGGRYRSESAPASVDPIVLVGWSAQLPGNPDQDTVREWLRSNTFAAPSSFGPEFPLPAAGEFRIPSSTMNTIDRCQVMALQCVRRLEGDLGQIWARYRATTGVIAGHLGPTRNGVGYALRTYLRYLTEHIQQDPELACLRPALPGYVDQVLAMVPVSNEDSSPGIMPNIIPARIANYFDFHGANMTVDTGYLSLLSAIDVGTARLRDGELDLALVLGINGNSTPELRAILGAGLDPLTELAEGAFLLALTRRSLADREGLPVLAQLDAARFVPESDNSPFARGSLPERHYLGADPAIDIIRATVTGRPTTVTGVDPFNGTGCSLTVRPADHVLPAATEPAQPAAAASPTPAAPQTVRPYAVVLRDCPAETVRRGVPAIPDHCLIVTNTPDLLAGTPRPENCVVFSTVATTLPGAILAPAQLDEDFIARQIDRIRWRPKHVRVLGSLGASREPTGSAFDDARLLSDLAFLAAKAVEPEVHGGGSYAVLLIDAVQGTVPRRSTGIFTGMVKSLAQEFGHALVYAVLSSTHDLALGLAQLAQESRKPRHLPLAVYDGDRRAVPVAVPRPAHTPGAVPLTRESVVVAAGGSRGVTAALLIALADQAAPTIWILGSNPLQADESATPPDSAAPAGPPSRAAFLERARSAQPGRSMAELNRIFDRLTDATEARDTIGLLAGKCGRDRVHYRVCDLTDRNSVEKSAREIRAVSGTIDLLVFGAGINRSALVAKKTLADFRAVRDVKAVGYANLRMALAADPPRSWCNLGSILGFTGQLGEVDYAAGNDFLSSSAQYARQVDGTDEYTIEWTLWDSIGLAAKPVTRAFLRRAGFSGGMSTEEGVALFLDELGRPEHDPVTVHLGAAELEMLENRFPGVRGAMADAAAPSPPVVTGRRPTVGKQLGGRANRTAAHSGILIEERVIDLDSDRYLLGHLVNGRPTLPGTFGFEMAAEVARKLVPDRIAVAFECVSFRKFLRLHPSRGSLQFRINARLVHSTPERSRVNVRVTSDIHAPTGELLVADQVHFELDVVLADDVVPAPPWTEIGAGPARPVADPYLIRNPAVLLSGALDTLRTTCNRGQSADCRFELQPDALAEPFDRFSIPALLLDGLARTSVLTMANLDTLPLVALSTIGRVELYTAANDITLARTTPGIRLISRPEPGDPSGRAFRCDAVGGDNRLIASISSMAGVTLGHLNPLTGHYQPVAASIELRQSVVPSRAGAGQPIG